MKRENLIIAGVVVAAAVVYFAFIRRGGLVLHRQDGSGATGPTNTGGSSSASGTDVAKSVFDALGKALGGAGGGGGAKPPGGGSSGGGGSAGGGSAGGGSAPSSSGSGFASWFKAPDGYTQSSWKDTMSNYFGNLFDPLGVMPGSGGGAQGGGWSAAGDGAGGSSSGSGFFDALGNGFDSGFGLWGGDTGVAAPDGGSDYLKGLFDGG